MAGGVAAAAQLFADLAGGQAEVRLQGVEDAGLPHAGVAGKGRDLSGQQATQFLDALAGGGADG